MMHGPQMMDPAMQAILAAQEEEEVQRRVEEIKEREERQERKEIKQRAQAQAKVNRAQDAKMAVDTMVKFCLFNCVMKVLCMFGGSWGSASFGGAGLKIAHIHSSMFYINVKVECTERFATVKEWLATDSNTDKKKGPNSWGCTGAANEENKVRASSGRVLSSCDGLCYVLSWVNGEYTLHNGMAKMCAVSDSACGTMTTLFYASLFLVLAFALHILMTLMGAAFLHNYWYSDHRPRLRKAAVQMIGCAMSMDVMGMIAWSAMADLKSMPQAWTTGGIAAAGGMVSLFGYQPVESLGFGWCWVLTCFLIFWEWVGFTIFMGYFRKHDKEVQAELHDALQREVLEERLDVARERLDDVRDRLPVEALGPGSAGGMRGPPMGGLPMAGLPMSGVTIGGPPNANLPMSYSPTSPGAQSMGADFSMMRRR